MVLESDRRDVDALLQERVEQLASLSGLTNAVARAASLEQTYAAALDCLAETLSPDRASVLLFDDDGVLRFKAWRRLSDEYRATTEGHTPWSPDTPDPKPVLVPEVALEPSLAELRPVIEREGIHALGFFPLMSGDRLLGKFMVYFDRPHVFTPTEVRLAEAIGSHIALEIARRRAEESSRGLHEAERRAREIAELLQGLSDALGRAVTQREIADVVVREGGAALGATAGWLARLDVEEQRLTRLAAQGYRPDLERAYSALPIVPGNPTVDVLVDGQARWFESARAVIEAYPALAADYPQTGFEAMAIVPVLVLGRSTGVIALNFACEREFRDDERRLLTAIATQCGLALERAALFAQLQERADAASVLAHVGDGVFQLDRRERVTLWNRGAEVLTGITEEEAVGREIHELIVGWESMKPFVSITEVPLAIGRREAVPATIGGRERWLAISGVETGESIVYAFRDVTDAERLEKARRDFLSTVSHELRTPLAAVFGATKTLLQREVDAETAVTLLRIIDGESERLTRILDEILLASRLDDGRVELATTSCDAVQLAGEVVEVARAAAPDGITLQLARRDDVPPVACDAPKLRQILVNLIDNAIKYSPEGGAVVVSFEPSERAVRISVSDEGLGVPPDERERIFEKFYRLDPDLARGVGGTGLGLYISRELMRRMNGRIWVESLPGRGSKFTVEVPLAS